MRPAPSAPAGLRSWPPDRNGLIRGPLPRPPGSLRPSLPIRPCPRCSTEVTLKWVPCRAVTVKGRPFEPLRVAHREPAWGPQRVPGGCSGRRSWVARPLGYWRVALSPLDARSAGARPQRASEGWRPARTSDSRGRRAPAPWTVRARAPARLGRSRARAQRASDGRGARVAGGRRRSGGGREDRVGSPFRSPPGIGRAADSEPIKARSGRIPARGARSPPASRR